MSPFPFWVSAGEEKRNYVCCWAQGPQPLRCFLSLYFIPQSYAAAAPRWQPACAPLSLTFKHCPYGWVFASACYFTCLSLSHRWTQQSKQNDHFTMRDFQPCHTAKQEGWDKNPRAEFSNTHIHSPVLSSHYSCSSSSLASLYVQRPVPLNPQVWIPTNSGVSQNPSASGLKRSTFSNAYLNTFEMNSDSVIDLHPLMAGVTQVLCLFSKWVTENEILTNYNGKKDDV